MLRSSIAHWRDLAKPSLAARGDALIASGKVHEKVLHGIWWLMIEGVRHNPAFALWAARLGGS
jgi:hypothetical protein